MSRKFKNGQKITDGQKTYSVVGFGKWNKSLIKKLGFSAAHIPSADGRAVYILRLDRKNSAIFTLSQEAVEEMRALK